MSDTITNVLPEQLQVGDVIVGVQTLASWAPCPEFRVYKVEGEVLSTIDGNTRKRFNVNQFQVRREQRERSELKPGTIFTYCSWTEKNPLCVPGGDGPLNIVANYSGARQGDPNWNKDVLVFWEPTPTPVKTPQTPVLTKGFWESPVVVLWEPPEKVAKPSETSDFVVLDIRGTEAQVGDVLLGYIRGDECETLGRAKGMVITSIDPDSCRPIEYTGGSGDNWYRMDVRFRVQRPKNKYVNPFTGVVSALREEDKRQKLEALEKQKQCDAAAKLLHEIMRVCGKAWLSDESVLRVANLELKAKPEASKVWKKPVAVVAIAYEPYVEPALTLADLLETD